jgi:hypothetical protein
MDGCPPPQNPSPHRPLPRSAAGVGSPFDPNVHEAIMREPNDDLPDGTVLEEFRKGFRLGETLLRPAMVKVRGAPVGACGGGQV